jgi:hypothetical protein
MKKDQNFTIEINKKIVLIQKSKLLVNKVYGFLLAIQIVLSNSFVNNFQYLLEN